jgi:hypothetical protein
MLDQAPLPTAEPFTLAGTIHEWDPGARRLWILNLDVVLAPHIPLTDLVSGLVVLVKGHHDGATGQRIATQLRRD